MSKQIAVSRSEVARAQLVVRLNESLGRATPAAIQKIAAASPAGSAEDNGHGNGDSNGR